MDKQPEWLKLLFLDKKEKLIYWKGELEKAQFQSEIWDKIKADTYDKLDKKVAARSRLVDCKTEIALLEK